MTKQVDSAQLKAFSPIDSLKKDNLAALAKKTKVREAQPGETLFREGDAEKRTLYVLSGTVELREGSKRIGRITGGSEDARNPLSPKLPRRHTAIATSAVEYITIDSDLLDVMLTWDQTGSYEVSELRGESAGSDDWMTTLLQTKAFHKIPPANIQAIFMRLQQVNYKAGDIVIKQGDEGDYFYVITRGKCVVTRETPLNKEGIRLAELQVGDTFGEEALISGPSATQPWRWRPTAPACDSERKTFASSSTSRCSTGSTRRAPRKSSRKEASGSTSGYRRSSRPITMKEQSTSRCTSFA
jgi:CRP-like cAMP-binding protein